MWGSPCVPFPCLEEYLGQVSSHYTLLATDNNSREGLWPLYYTVYSPTEKKTNVSHPVYLYWKPGGTLTDW